MRFGLGAFELRAHGSNVLILDSESKRAAFCFIRSVENVVKDADGGVPRSLGGYENTDSHRWALKSLTIRNLVSNGIDATFKTAGNDISAAFIIKLMKGNTIDGHFNVTPGAVHEYLADKNR